MAQDLVLIKHRMRDAILPRQPADRERLAVSAAGYLKALRQDGSWSDIDYDSASRSFWMAGRHLDRILVLAKSYATPGQALYGDADLHRGVVAALDWWLRHDYQNPNWWWNQIGVPQIIGETALLLEDDLTPERRAKVLEILSRSKWTPGQGQNTVWLAGNSAVKGLLEPDAGLVERAFSAIWDEIQLARPPKEGIQPDASFHQHGDQLYNGGYGLAFGNDVARYIAHAWGTPYQPPADKLELFTRYLLDGQQWMVRGRIFDYSAVGREITRIGKVGLPGSWTTGPISPAGAAYGLMNAVDLMGALPVPRRDELQSFALRLRRTPDAPPLDGNRHFPFSDYMAHHRPGFFASVKMLSKRMVSAEVVNDEGRKSHHLSDGATFLYRTGEEFYDIFAVWDWNCVPGATAEVWRETPPPSKVQRRGSSAFVGGVSDGRYGLAAMDFQRDALAARKAWFFIDEGFTALGAGIASTGELAVRTSVQQEWLRGPVHVEGRGGPLPTGEHALADARWALHDGVGYVFAEGQRVTLKNATQTGRWSDFGTQTDAPQSGEVFGLWIDHGTRPTADTYEYTVLPGTDTESLSAFARKPPIIVVSNRPDLQAVRHDAARVMGVAFYRPGLVDGGRAWTLAADRPCLLLVREDGDGVVVAVSNPENTPLTVNVSSDRRLAGDGAVAAGSGTRLTFELPGGDDAGGSVVRRFTSVVP